MSATSPSVISQAQKSVKNPYQENLQQFRNNANIANVINKIEQRHNMLEPLKDYPSDVQRARKFRKPMDTLKLRQERIDMVKGMNQIENGVVSKKEKDKPVKSVFAQQEETESSLTHKEMEEISQKYNLTWQ